MLVRCLAFLSIPYILSFLTKVRERKQYKVFPDFNGISEVPFFSFEYIENQIHSLVHAGQGLYH